ncbi:MAG: hypothetical protein ACRDCE_20210 [Cetobacterium sp.]|uniref:ATP-dependent DNA ligase n=1 Tax=Cetobacterium sp. TaxID=2071632 RepID=UPI003EE6E05B
MQITINPYKPVSFNEKAIRKVLETSGSLIADVKYDSVRCHLVILPTADVKGQPAARLYALSRTNKAIPALRELFASADDMIKLGLLLSESLYPEGLIIDGEMMVKGVDFNTGSGLLRRKTPIETSRLTYMIYGVLPAQDIIKDPSAEIQIANCVMQAQTQVLIHQVKELLPELDWQLALSYDVFDMESLQEIYELVRAGGHEGLVVKDPMGFWKRGKKVGWWKMKPEDEIDGTVVGVVWGTEGKANEGKVIGFEVLLENERVVNACGLTQDQMARFTSNIEYNPEYYKGWACQVKFMETTPDGSLRHPSFDRWRGVEGNETEKM